MAIMSVRFFSGSGPVEHFTDNLIYLIKLN